MPLALARKYRPRSFAAVAVQSHVSTTLKGAIAHDRVANAYLFCGPRGTGKTTLARVLAMALNCEHRSTRTDGEPCGECTSCQRIWSGSASLDVVEIDAASNRGVDDARALRERAMYAPSAPDRYKVYIIDEAHMLTREAWNALLKVLEEPPNHVVFVFATTEPQKIAQLAAPALSRLQRFDLKRIGIADIRKRLRDVLSAEGIAGDDEAVLLLARAADGSMRDALSLLDQVLSIDNAEAVTVARVRDALGLVADDEFLTLLQIIADRRAGDVFSTVARLADAGVDWAIFLAGFADVLRTQLATVLGIDSPDLSDAMRSGLVKLRGTWSAGDLLRMLQMITELEPRFRRSGQPQLLLEMLLVQCALLDRTVNLEDLLRTMANPGGKGPEPRTAARTVPRAESRSDTRPSAPPRGSTSSGPDSIASYEPVAKPSGVSPHQQTPGGPPQLEARWPEIVARVRRDHQAATLALALQQSVPEWGRVGAGGGEPETLIVRLTERNDFLARAIEAGRSDLLVLAKREWPAVERIEVAMPEDRPGGAPRRLTVEAVRADQVASLRKRDAVLGAAIDALDLELLE